MAQGLRPLPLDLPDLKPDSFDPSQATLKYDKLADILSVLPRTPRPATSIDLDTEVWARVDLKTGEIVGYEIDDFELVFLKKHPDLAAAWQEIRPKASGDRVQFFLEVLQQFMRSIMGNHPQQPKLQPHST